MSTDTDEVEGPLQTAVRAGNGSSGADHRVWVVDLAVVNFCND